MIMNDENNGKELLYVCQKTAEITKKRFIYNAIKWLKDNIDFEHDYPNSKEELINDFKKAMEVL